MAPPGPSALGLRAERSRGSRRWLVAASLVSSIGLCALVFESRDPTPRILERRGALSRVVLGEVVPAGSFVDQEVRIGSTSGLEVELSVRRPMEKSELRRPAVLLLGGHRTGRGAAALIQETRGTVVAAMSYPTTLKRIKSVGDVHELRRAILDTPAALMLAVDYLLTRPEVDPDRIEIVGVSLGAPFACVAGALDQRLSRVWAIHGGGSTERILAAALEKKLASPRLRSGLGHVIAVLIHGIPLAPEKWVGRIAPRPFVMINGREDRSVPRECVEELFEAAREPKELMWVPGGHIDKRNLEQVVGLCEIVLQRIDSQTAVTRGGA